MNERIAKLLYDALEACRAAESFADELARAVGIERDIALSAVERKVEIVGNALRQAVQIDGAVEEQIPRVREIIAIRQQLLHEYDVVESESVLEIVRDAFPLMARQMTILLHDAA
jgi:uncharacterized protein with HEPN domain